MLSLDNAPTCLSSAMDTKVGLATTTASSQLHVSHSRAAVGCFFHTSMYRSTSPPSQPWRSTLGEERYAQACRPIKFLPDNFFDAMTCVTIVYESFRGWSEWNGPVSHFGILASWQNAPDIEDRHIRAVGGFASNSAGILWSNLFLGGDWVGKGRLIELDFVQLFTSIFCSSGVIRKLTEL